eukprot:scaffold10384_cov30-Tisochrysis_lutea.AAC.5
MCAGRHLARRTKTNAASRKRGDGRKERWGRDPRPPGGTKCEVSHVTCKPGSQACTFVVCFATGHPAAGLPQSAPFPLHLARRSARGTRAHPLKLKTKE